MLYYCVACPCHSHPRCGARAHVAPIYFSTPRGNPTGHDAARISSGFHSTIHPLLGLILAVAACRCCHRCRKSPSHRKYTRATLPPRLVKKILELEFADILPRQLAAPHLALPITEWLERFSMMAAVLASRFPEKAPELFAYQATIVRAERSYEGNRWVSYDRQFRRDALARKDLNWSVTDFRLYNEAFTGRARAIASCSFCLQDDHMAPQCPRNPDRQWFNWMPFPLPAGHIPPVPAAPAAPFLSPSYHQEICRRFNEGRCKQFRCRYLHACKECQGPHPWLSCPRNQGGRGRSPIP